MGISAKINRRKFITTGTLGLIGLPFISARPSVAAPSDRVRVAVIGLGSQGRSHMNWFNSLPEVEVAALCDLDRIRLEEARTQLQKINPESKAEIFSDFRQILERKDIDAVTCATPDHWHALIAIMAFQAGKDVYGEKPLTYSLAEGQAMLRNLEKHNSVFQLGTQIHAGENYHRVTEILQSGKLGKIHTVRLWKTGGSPGLGFPVSQKPPETLDWDMWLGPAPYEEYTPVRCHGTYRHFLDYSGGVFADFWCHIADIMFMSIHPEGLYSIESRGERPDDGIADAPKWIEADFKFKDMDVFWTTTPPEAPGSDKMYIGAHFEGTNGTLTCDYTTRFIKINDEILTDLPDVPVSIPRSPGHQQNFIDAVKSRSNPESNLHYVREMTIPMHLAVISFRLKRKLIWDSLKEEFTGDKAANYLLSRTYRKPWVLPE